MDIIGTVSIVYKTVIIYFVILLVIRMMGKRELGQLSPFDLVIAIMIGELAVFPIEERQITLIEGLLPIFILGLLEILLAFVSLKSNQLRSFFNSRPEVLIKDGKIDYQALRRTRYNINDLLQQLRQKDIFDLSKVDLAILETSGDLSVLKKGDGKFKYPVVFDGHISINPKMVRVDEAWLNQKIKKDGHQLSEILLATIDESKNIEYYKKKL